MQLPDFLAEHAYGSIRLTGHRIALEHVVELYDEGYTPEMLHEEYPTLPLDLINRVIAFYLENRVEVSAYVAESQTEVERQRATTPRVSDFEELRRRMEEMGRLEKP